MSLSKFSSVQLSTPSIGEKPNQPRSVNFPQREFGQKATVKRSFQPQWFNRWPWIHYDENSDAAFCFLCVKAYYQKKLDNCSSLETTYISTGYTNWKDASVRFNKHENSRCHKDAVLKTVTIPASCKDIGEVLSSQLAKEKLERRQCFLKLMSSIRYLARQALPIRGDGNESNSNYMQLLKLRGEDDARILEWLTKKTDKYTSVDMQNEMLKTMALHILRQIIESLEHTPFITLMVDETTDVSNQEQAVFCLRWVDQQFEVHEEFIGLYALDSTDASHIFAVIKAVLGQLHIPINKIRGQCYDGAAAMAGTRSGVAKRVLAEEARAIYTHCYGHALSLACADTIKKCKVMKDALDITHEVTKLIKKSPARDRCFEKIKSELAPDTPGVRVLCPTRWTVRAEALQSILNNYMVLQELWMESLDKVKDSEMKARILGVASQMKTFNYLFGIVLGDLILRHSDNLSRTLQKVDISAAQGQEVASMTVKTLKSLRSDNNYKLFWKKVTTLADKLEVSEPALPRRRKVPKRLDDGTAEHEYPATTEDHFRQIYYEALDLIISCITDRFDQPGYRIYHKVQDLILKAAKQQDYQDELDFIINYYGDDFDASLLKTHLEIFSTNMQCEGDVTLSEVIKFFKAKNTTEQDFLSQLCKLLRLLLVMPATNASSERSFSALRRIKTYLRSTMTQARLNHIMIMNIHKNLTDELDMIHMANLFVADHPHRHEIFGSFKTTDVHSL